MDRVRLRAELRQLDSLPTLPWIAVKVMEAALSEDSSPEDVARLIEADQALTLRVLRAANSAFYKRSRQVSQVKDAILLMGFNALKGLKVKAARCLLRLNKRRSLFVEMRLGGGGKIAVSTGSNARSVFVKVGDTGKGMSQEVMEKIFRPFFTTKGARGTGLGLSISYSIITRHRGEISVESRQ